MSTREERGTKQVCPACNGKFYDLNRDSIPCPICGTMFVASGDNEAADPLLEAEKRAEAKPAAAAKAKPVPAAAAAAAEGEETEDEDVEVAAELADLEDDDDVASNTSDDTFLEDEDEEGESVAGIIVPTVENDSGDE
ncbi:MAG: TIGR02300 family protein [Pseudomonadota bacterium]